MSSLPIANLLNQHIYVAPFQDTINDMGDVIYGKPEKRRCRIDFGKTLVYGLDGTAVPSIATIYTDTAITAKDKLMIPTAGEHAPDSEIIGRIDFMQIDLDAFIKSGWAIEGTYLVRIPLEVKTLYDGMGVFSHCEVAI